MCEMLRMIFLAATDVPSRLTYLNRFRQRIVLLKIRKWKREMIVGLRVELLQKEVKSLLKIRT